VIIIYLRFVRAGTSTGTLGGIYLSLIPSTVISGVAWYTKKRLLISESKKPKPKHDGSFINRYAGAFHNILKGEDEELSQHENLNIPHGKSNDRGIHFQSMENGKYLPTEAATRL